MDPYPPSISKDKKIKGFIPVISAIIGNFVITIFKIIGFFASGSGSLFSEAIHSFADTLNQILLYVGIKKSSKKEDSNFSYGYKKERYFRATISACGIFYIGAGVTIYHGINSLLNPHEITALFQVIVILFVSLIVESITLYIALKSVYDKKIGFIQSIKKSDNATLAVILEDSIAVLGVIIASISILLSYYTGILIFDSIGSIIIGIMLGVVATHLIIINKHYLIGKGIDPVLKKDVIDFLKNYDYVENVIDFKSHMLDFDTYIIKCEIEFNGAALTKELNKNHLYKKEYEEIKDDYVDFLKFCSYLSNLIPRVMGEKINLIEKDIKMNFPKIKYIDLEIN